MEMFLTPDKKGTSMTEIMTIGLDLAKTVFQVHGADGEGRAVLRRRLRRGQIRVFCHGPALLDRIGSLRERSLLGARVAGVGTRRSADPAAICEAVREDQQERCGGRGGDLRSGAAPHHAVRRSEERRSAIRVDAAPLARVTGAPAHDADQRLARTLRRVRHRCRARSPEGDGLDRGDRGS